MLFRKQGGAGPDGPAALFAGRGVHPSPGLKEMLEHLGGGGGSVLDLGPADEGTLSFLGGLGYEVQVADLSGAVRLEELAFEEEAYRAVLAWDLLFRTPSEQRPALADTLTRYVRPGGVLFLVMPPDGRAAGWSYRFRILGPSRLEYRPGRSLLAGPVPTNREVLALFSSMQCNGARLLRHGAREFLLRRPGLA